MTGRTWIALLLLGCAPVTIAAAQQQPPLAEVARQEAERRQAVKSSSRVYTNDDVKKASGAPLSVVSGATSAGSSAPSSPAEAPGDATAAQPKPAPDPAKDEAAWRKRAADAREQLQRSRLFAEALQSRINALTTDFVARDDPYQRQQIAQQRQEALAELDRVRRDIEGQTKALDDLEDQARRAGVPAGWLR
jgi:hypothetical protein